MYPLPHLICESISIFSISLVSMEEAELLQQKPIYPLELWNPNPSTFSRVPFSLLHFQFVLVFGSSPSMYKHAKECPMVKTDKQNPSSLIQYSHPAPQFLFHTQ